MKKSNFIFILCVVIAILIFKIPSVPVASNLVIAGEGSKQANDLQVKDTSPLQNSKELFDSKKEKEVAPETETPNNIEENNQEISKKQFIVCIDSGHQKKANLEKESIGPGAEEMKIKVSQGTRGVATGKPEYVLNLEASLILEEVLIEKGVKVVMTRKDNDVDISNKERSEIANNSAADLFVRIHADGSNDPNMAGAHILIPAKDNPYTPSIEEESERAAKIVLKHLESHVDLAVNPLSYRKDISGFNWSEVPVFLLEMGFMTNPQEDQKLSDPQYLRSFMELVANGVVSYLDTKEI